MHPYFDLTGNKGTVANSALRYTMHAPACAHYLPVDGANVPTGTIADATSTPYDFRTPRLIGANPATFNGYDNFLVASTSASLDGPIQHLTTLVSPPDDNGSAVQLVINSNQPGFQVYTANGFDGTGDGAFAMYGSVAVEPSGFVDACNHEGFPTIELQPSQTKRQIIQYHISRITPT